MPNTGNGSNWLKWIFIGCGCLILGVIILIGLIVGCGIWAVKTGSKMLYSPPPPVTIASSVSSATSNALDFLLGLKSFRDAGIQRKFLEITEGDMNAYLEEKRSEESQIESLLVDLGSEGFSLYSAVSPFPIQTGDRQPPKFFPSMRMSVLVEFEIRKDKSGKVLWMPIRYQVGSFPAEAGRAQVPQILKIFSEISRRQREPFFRKVYQLLDEGLELPPEVKSVEIASERIRIQF